MKLTFKISKIANLFFFISNLSEWHFSCVLEYNEIWLGEIGKLSDPEIRQLRKLKRVLKKYDFRKRNNHSIYLGAALFNDNETAALQKLKAQINKDEYDVVYEAMLLFSDKFSRLWKEIFPRLRLIKSYLDNESKKERFSEILYNISALFQSRLPLRSHKIFLLGAPRKSGVMGGTYFEQGLCSLEVSSLKEKESFLRVLLHELAHECSEAALHKNIKRFIKQHSSVANVIRPIAKIFNRSASELLEELAILSFLPDGYLRELHFSYKRSGSKTKRSLTSTREQILKKDWFVLEEFIIKKMRDSAREYVAKSQPIDNNYSNSIINALKELQIK